MCGSLPTEGRAPRAAYPRPPATSAEGKIKPFFSTQGGTPEQQAGGEITRQVADSLRSIVSAMPLIVFATDADGRFTLVEALGLEKQWRRPGDPASRLAPELHLDAAVQSYVQRALAGETFMTAVAIGDAIFDTRFSPLHADDGSVTGCLGVALDVTEQIRMTVELVLARDAAEAATRAKSAFLATMSHEIRTPLNAVIGTADLLLDIASSEEQRQHAETIRSSGNMLLALINDVLDFSKIEAGNMELERRSFDLRATVDEVLNLLAPRAAEKGLHLAAAIDVAVPQQLVGDPTRVRQILLNLMGNAVKFTHAGEVLARALCHRRPDGSLELELSVSDTGIGIPADRLGRLFQPFNQVDASTTRRYGGTGLGLAICRRLCELMGGSIGVSSDEGAGSTFTVRLPTATGDAEQRGGHSARPPLPEAGAPPLRILLAEDNAVNQQVATRMLERLGYRADVVGNGLEVLRALEQRDYDLILMDVQMPELDGLEATRRIRAATATARQPHIIAMTANAMAGDREACLAAGMNDYISKPVQRETLMLALRRVPSRPPAGPATPIGDNPGDLDDQTINRLRSDLGPDFEEDMAALVETYRQQLRTDVASLRAANAAGDHERVALLAHRLRGASATLGARHAAHLCRAVEQGGQRGEDVGQPIEAMVAAAEQAATAMIRLIGGGPR